MDMRCKDCGRTITQQGEKAIASGEWAVVWANGSGEWVCPVTRNEHVPGVPAIGTFIVVEGNPIDGLVFHGIPAFQTHDDAHQWAADNCSVEWWVAPLQDVEW